VTGQASDQRETGSTPMTLTTAGMRATGDRVHARPDGLGRLLQAHPERDGFRPGSIRAEPGSRAALMIAAGCSKGTCSCR
jgi:hypothetical protein